jgi:hypothetical protein
MTQIIVITSAIPPHFDFVVKLPRWPLDDETRDFSVENDENKSFQSIFFPCHVAPVETHVNAIEAASDGMRSHRTCNP